MMKKAAIGIGIAVAAVTVFCLIVNAEYKRECREAEHYVNLMHEMVGI